jgi:hypothetical protein
MKLGLLKDTAKDQVSNFSFAERGTRGMENHGGIFSFIRKVVCMFTNALKQLL